jgi:hypothetical protein
LRAAKYKRFDCFDERNYPQIYPHAELV